MGRILTGFLSLLLAGPVLRSQDTPQDKPPPTPAEQYKALQEEYQAAQQAFQKAYQEATTQEERQKVAQEKYPQPDKFVGRFLELAEKNPKEAAALDALVWVVTHGHSFDKNSPRGRALEILQRDYLTSEKLDPVCQYLAFAQDKASETLLRTVLDKNPHRAVQGQACLALGEYLRNRADTARRLKEQPKLVKQYEAVLGKEFKQDLLAADADKAAKESEQLLERVLDKYADLKHFRGTLGERAKAQLYEIRELAVGKPAPAIEGEDIDGQKFKLSDYRGKVVLLDFWGHW